jgi:hypothetical protein
MNEDTDDIFVNIRIMPPDKRTLRNLHFCKLHFIATPKQAKSQEFPNHEENHEKIRQKGVKFRHG